MRATKSIMSIAAVAVGTAALALPPFVGEFAKLAKPPAGSALAKANCASCHVGMAATLNPFGKDLKKALQNHVLDAGALKRVALLDSDKDGAKNGAEIKAGTLPGDKKSKPKKK